MLRYQITVLKKIFGLRNQIMECENKECYLYQIMVWDKKMCYVSRLWYGKI